MGLPQINITFSNAASAAVQRSQRGVVAVILKDDGVESGGLALTKASQIPAGLSVENQTYVRQAFTGYVNPPRKVLVYVLAANAADYTAALAWFATRKFDWLAGAPDCTAALAADIKSWIAAQRETGAVYKAVLPDTAADSEAIVNFTADGMTNGTTIWTTAQFCARIAGMIAGTPLTVSCTYAPLEELTDIKRLTKTAMDAAVDAGQLILMHDGEKVKVARGVNSLTTTTAARGDSFKKIKIAEAVDMMRSDLTAAMQDTYIGRYANSYDNKCVLLTAVQDYFLTLEAEGILQAGGSAVEIDADAQEAYLEGRGVDTSGMTEQEIKEYNTGDQVFLKATVSILDAIEDITLAVTV